MARRVVHMALLRGKPPAPRMVTCGLSCVMCCRRHCQHNRQHMQATREKAKLVNSRGTALGAFRKQVEKKLDTQTPPPPLQFAPACSQCLCGPVLFVDEDRNHSSNTVHSV